ncbi:olfactory receptor 1M1-like [Centropristis striata]|uniref:olfactory receptor 1M1-like n=1 Tax=Centropristis striata TaxID=184440 RepID=UPI0027DF267D|nr:olfactory receptor 1M1-like [Centropristis striata]
MSSLRTVLNDSVIIHPPGFYLIAFETLPYISLYLIFLTFVYVVAVLFNSLVIYVIAFDHRLHTPKYLAVVNLAVVDIIFNTSIIPSMIKAFLFKNNFIQFNLCFVQMFFYYTFGTLESITLAILAYDRLIAICFPLRHNSINTLRSMSCVIGLTWCFALGIIAFSTGIITRLSFCNSVRVSSFFCGYGAVSRLACSDYTLQLYLALYLVFLLLLGPFAFIVLSYMSVLVTVFRMKSVDSRVKALTTCVEHFILVTVFYAPLISIFIIEFYVQVHPDVRALGNSLAACIPPCINPIVYSLKTKEIKIRVLALVRKTKTGTDKCKSKAQSLREDSL